MPLQNQSVRDSECDLIAETGQTAEPGDNRRSKRAKAVLLIAGLSASQSDDFALIHDLSPFGMKVTTKQKLKLYEPVKLEFGSGLSISGRVRWLVDDHAGIEFDQPIDPGPLFVGARKLGSQNQQFSGRKPRAFPRLRRCGSATIRSKGQAHHVKVINASPVGLCLELDAPLSIAVGDWLVVSVDGFGEVGATVRWVKGREMGMLLDQPTQLWKLDSWLGLETRKCSNCEAEQCSAPSFKTSRTWRRN